MRIATIIILLSAFAASIAAMIRRAHKSSAEANQSSEKGSTPKPSPALPREEK